jgi:VanZ family protein
MLSHQFNTSNSLKILLWTTVLAIPVISLTGRWLQHWLERTIGLEKTGWLIITLLCITAMAYIIKHITNWNALWWRLLVILPILFAIIHFVPIIEERIHFILFGALGYLGITILGTINGVIICVLFSVGDEFLQWLLPYRVGDMRDVAFNLIASSIGIVLALVEQRVK